MGNKLACCNPQDMKGEATDFDNIQTPKPRAKRTLQSQPNEEVKTINTTANDDDFVREGSMSFRDNIE